MSVVPAEPARGAVTGVSSDGGAPLLLNWREKTSAMRATSAMPATAHGAAAAMPVAAGAAAAVAAACLAPCLPPAPVGVPHLWQNFAPGGRSAPHSAHFPPLSVAPQLEQKRPLAGWPQFGQGAVVLAGFDMRIR